MIMVGEIRDPITAETAVRAANSGQLVFATLHAPIAAGAVDSMLALDVVPYFLSTCLIGVVSQRLVRTLCEECRMSFDLSAAPETFKDIKHLLEPGQGEHLYSSPGCDHCHHTGFTNRTGVVEVLRATTEIRQMIVERRRAREISDAAVRQGMLDLRHGALLKVAQGVTCMEEVVRRIAEYLLPEAGGNQPQQLVRVRGVQQADGDGQLRQLRQSTAAKVHRGAGKKVSLIAYFDTVFPPGKSARRLLGNLVLCSRPSRPTASPSSFGRREALISSSNKAVWPVTDSGWADPLGLPQLFSDRS